MGYSFLKGLNMAKWEPVSGAIAVPYLIEDQEFDFALDLIAKVIYRQACRFNPSLPTNANSLPDLPGRNQGASRC